MVKEKGTLRITSKGFQFLLQDMHIQVWALLLQYLELSEELQMNQTEVLAFLFQLGSLEFGQNYSIELLTLTQKKLLNDLKYLGLIYQRNKKSSRFYPTRMATGLASGNEMEFAIQQDVKNKDAPSSNNGYILIETNFRVYAYTKSPLQIAILSLFVDMQSRFANMVVGVITRDSVREALQRGIAADQVGL
jgi:transcription initiation factor TFIIH subunit 4